MLESTRSIMFDDCNPPGYYTKPSSHCWIPHVWCQHPRLWSTKTQKHIVQPPFSCLNMAKPSVFFISSCSSFRTLRHPAWRKATRHTLNKAQLTANKGRARDLITGNHQGEIVTPMNPMFCWQNSPKTYPFPHSSSWDGVVKASQSSFLDSQICNVDFGYDRYISHQIQHFSSLRTPQSPSIGSLNHLSHIIGDHILNFPGVYPNFSHWIACFTIQKLAKPASWSAPWNGLG